MKARYNKMMGQLGMDRQTKAAMLERLTRDQKDTAGKPAASRKSALPGRVLLAACLALALAVTALAVELTVGWGSFFGRVPDKVTTPVGVSAQSGDYTITLEETIVDQDGAAFLMSLRRADGGVLEGEPGTFGMDLRIRDELANMSFDYQDPIRSEDGTAIYYCFQFRQHNEEIETLEGREIVLSYQGIVDDAWTEEEIQRVWLETVSLAPLAPAIGRTDAIFDCYPDMENPDFVAASELLETTAVPGALPLQKWGGRCSLAGGVLSQDGKTLALAIYEPEGKDREGNYMTTGADAIALVDSRTGESVAADVGHWTLSGYGVTFFELSRPMTLDDLSELETTVKYNTVKYLSDEPFELTFPITDSGYRREYALDRQVELGFHGFRYRYNVHATALRVSALELRLFVDAIEGVEKEPSEETPCKLLYDDGRELALKGGLSLAVVNHPEQDGYLAFRPRENVLLDPDRAVALLLGDTRIDLK